MSRKKYNHAFTIAFEVITKASCDGNDYPTEEELLAALEKRLRSFCSNSGEIFEAVGKPYDTYEVKNNGS